MNCLYAVSSQFMNQTRQGMKIENAPGVNPAMRPGMQPGLQPGMQPGMQPTGMAGQVCSQHFLTLNECSVHSLAVKATMCRIKNNVLVFLCSLIS